MYAKMSFSETSEHAMLRESVAKIAADFGHEYYLEKARKGGKATELWRALGKAGFMGVNIPEEYGGSGLGISELAIVAEEVAAQGCPLLLMLVSPTICGTVISKFGTPAQKQRFLPPLASGEKIMAFAITEPDAGSNSHKISTVATRDGDNWVLKGTKYYISGSDEAENILVVTRTGIDEKSGKGKLSLFVVDSKAAGLKQEIIPVEITAPEKQFTLFFDDVVVPGDRLVGTEGEGLKQVFQGLNPERIMGAAVGNGVARYALAKASRYANERAVWGVPIGSHQGVAHPLAEAKIQLELARLMTRKAAWLFDQGADAGEASNMAKLAAADAALLCLDRAMQTHGGNGLATEYGLATLYGLARLLKVAPVSREMILNYVATRSLGLPKSY